MAHWAQIDENNNVINVTVGNNDDPNGDEGYQWLIDMHGGTWIKCSYNTLGGVHYNLETQEPSKDQSKALRKNYPGIGFTYDPVRDAFIPPKIDDNMILDEETCLWVYPDNEE